MKGVDEPRNSANTFRNHGLIHTRRKIHVTGNSKPKPRSKADLGQMVGRNTRAHRHRVLGEPQRATGRALAPVSRLSTAHGCSAAPVHSSKCGRIARVWIGHLVSDLRLPPDSDHPARVEGVDACGTLLHCMATLELVAPRQPAR